MKLKDVLLGLLVTGIWGANFSVIRIGLSDMDPFVLTCMRFALCAFPLMCFVRRPAVDMRIVAAYGALFGGGLWGLVNLGIHYGLSAGLASLLLQLSAFFTVALGHLLLGEKIGGRQAAGMAVALCGLGAVLGSSAGNGSLPGMALLICAAGSWSVCNVMVRRTRPNDMFAFVVWASGFSAATAFALTLAVKGPDGFQAAYAALSWTGAASVAFQAYVTTLFGYWTWNSLLKRYSAGTVAPLSLFVPVAGMLTSHVVFGEAMTAGKLVAAACILTGLAFLLGLPGTRSLQGLSGRSKRVRQP